VRLLDEVGVLKKLLLVGREVHGVGIQADGAPRVRLQLPSPALAVPQSALEEALLGALRAAGVEFRSPCEATTIQQDASKVRLRVVRKELVTLGSPGHYSEWEPVDSSLITADYVIGADGYDSRVRTALGIDVATLGATESFAMFETPAHAETSADVEIAFKDDLVSAVVPLANSRARLGFQLASGLEREPDAQRLHELMVERAPWFHDGMHQVDWSSVIHFERRLVRRFGSGRVWLAGDAAHVTSPFGAHSMNIGLSEAHDFVRRIAVCLREGTSPAALGEYGAVREREWHKLLGVNAKFDLLPHAPAWLAEHARRVAPTLPASGADLRDLLRQLGLAVT
jgi:2-polyprenyl-6-methoxyphenol hydroxylase-like FAD-dependent oxidoreductase